MVSCKYNAISVRSEQYVPLPLAARRNALRIVALNSENAEQVAETLAMLGLSPLDWAVSEGAEFPQVASKRPGQTP